MTPWSQFGEVLDEHRGLNPAEPLSEADLGSPQIIDSGPAPASLDHAGHWPPYLPKRSGFDFLQQGDSNRIAIQAASEVIDYPARRLNPLLIHGTAGTGKVIFSGRLENLCIMEFLTEMYDSSLQKHSRTPTGWLTICCCMQARCSSMM